MSAALPEVVCRYVDAYNSLDVDGMLATLTDDVVFENISNGSAPVRTEGKAQLAVLARQSVAVFMKRQQTVVSQVVEAERVALRVTFEAIVASDLPNGWKAGQQLNLVGASFLDLREGRIARIVDLS